MSEYVMPERKTCPGCSRDLPASEYGTRGRYGRKYLQWRCRDCARKYGRERERRRYRMRNPNAGAKEAECLTREEKQRWDRNLSALILRTRGLRVSTPSQVDGMGYRNSHQTVDVEES